MSGMGDASGGMASTKLSCAKESKLAKSVIAGGWAGEGYGVSGPVIREACVASSGMLYPLAKTRRVK
jgi:hypothetical protein